MALSARSPYVRRGGLSLVLAVFWGELVSPFLLT